MKLQPLIERYIAYRQALGESFKTNASVLRAFGRAVGARAAIAAVGARQVRAFLDGTGPITRAWFGRHSALLGFSCYASTRGYVAVSPLPVVLPQRPPPFIPHIYTQDELRRLLEVVVRDHPSVRGCVVFGLDDPDWGQVVCAAVQADPALTLDELRAWMKGRIADDKRPRRLVLVERFPLTGTGKVARRLLRDEVAGRAVTT